MAEKRARRRPAGNPLVAVAYLRVSTEDQHLGPEAQRASIEAWAGRSGVRIAEWFTDQGVSGATPVDERPGLLAAISRLQEEHAGVLVAAKRDRFARDVMVVGFLSRHVQGFGAQLRTADGTSDNTSPEGELMTGIVDLFAQYERAMIRARTKAALAAKKARGERVGTVPYGFRVETGSHKLKVHEAERKIVDAVRGLREKGFSVRRIASLIRDMGMRSLRTGEPFGKSQVHAMIRGEK
jgi:DNA invertase Pin-like site-specific DNA recombinase